MDCKSRRNGSEILGSACPNSGTLQDCLRTLLKEDINIIIESGPGSVLSGLVRHHLGEGSNISVINFMPHARDRRSEDCTLAHAVASLWEAGGNLDWEAYSSPEKLHRIPLPTYPFERRRYWVDPSDKLPTQPPVTLTARNILDESFYFLSWKKAAPVLLSKTLALPKRESWLLIHDGGDLPIRVAQSLRSLGQHCICAQLGDEFLKKSENEYSLMLSNVQQVRALCEELNTQDVTLDHVLDFSAYSGEKACAGHRTFHGLLGLIQGFGAGGQSHKFRLTVISSGLHDITGFEQTQPEKALLFGPLWVIPQEYPAVSARNIDVEADICGGAAAQVATSIIAEAHLWPEELCSAYRRAQRWVQTCERVAVPPVSNGGGLRTKGVYLITGGLGGLGLALTEFMAEAHQARIALVTRRSFPPHREWNRWLAEHHHDDDTSLLINKLARMENNGAEVEVFSSDVSDSHLMRGVVGTIKERWGGLNGVIHAAGVAGGGVIELKTAAAVQRVFEPKVEGALSLLSALREETPDFIALFSSVEAVRGSVGQIDYSAANAYLDAVARSEPFGNGMPIISINWGAWRDVGMAVDTPVPSAMQEHRTQLLRDGITTAEGLEAFRRILGSSLRQVIVSPTSFKLPAASRATQVAVKESKRPADQLPKRRFHPRPNLDTPFVAPSNEIEDTLVKLWRDLLGIEDIGVDDDFFALGGHSLMAVRLTFSIREAFDIPFALKDLFASPTIGSIASLVLLRHASSLGENEVADLIQEIDRYSDDEVRGRLRNQQ